MNYNTKKNQDGMFKNVMLAYLILILHVMLASALVLLIVFLHGITTHLFWIFFGGIALLIISGYIFYRKMKAEGKTLRDILNSPMFKGRTVEISLLNGLAYFKIGKANNLPGIESKLIGPDRQLEAPGSTKVRELSELARLLQENLITTDEYNQLKKELFNKSYAKTD